MSTFTPRPGQFSWFELGTSDQAAAKTFYQTLFGWTSTDTPMGPNEIYTVFKLDGRDVGACYTLRPGQQKAGVPPHWMLYVAVANADDTAKRVGALGGSVIVEPFDVMDLGRMAVIADPTGAMFSLWQANKQPGVGVWGEVGSVAWADLQSRDQEKNGAFYSALLGWKMVEGKSMNPAKPGDYYHIVTGEDFIGGISPAGQVNPQAPPHWLIYVEVTDCKATTAKAISLGARAYVDTMEIPNAGKFSVIADPQGAVFAVHQSMR